MTTSATQVQSINSASESDANMLWATHYGPGLDIHEAPGINSRNHTILKAGHVVTVERGLYYSGTDGVRLEDVVRVTKAGCNNLVRTPKILEV